MASPLDHVLRHVRQLAGTPADELTDGELLERFIQNKDETAFDRLMQRHGRMVLGVCRAYLNDVHDAEDAFQATFLVLVRSAHSVRKQSSLSSWLHGVAYRTALKARAAAARRRREEQVAAMNHPDLASTSAGKGDDRPVLVEELQRLPEKYRAPLLLCYQEGKTTAETARQLGWPQGTVTVRLMRGRDMLRSRLTRRGMALSAVALPLALAETASAAIPPTLAQSTLQAALLSAAPPLAAGSLPASVTALTEGVLHAMLLDKIKRVAALILALTLLVGATGLFTYQKLAAKDDAPPVVALPEDPQAMVLVWDYLRPELARKTEEPLVRLKADGSLTVNDPYGSGKPIATKLSAKELQAVLRFAIREQSFFAMETDKLQGQIRAERRQKGLSANEATLPTTVLRIAGDGQQKELRCADLRRYADSSPATKQLVAIEQRLERLIAWAYAGGDAGVESALAMANEQLRREVPEAPLLQASDLQSAIQGSDGGLEVTFERRKVAQDPFTFVYARMERPTKGEANVVVKANLAAPRAADGKAAKEINLNPPAIATDSSVKYDYPIVYIRLARQQKTKVWAQAGVPLQMNQGADLMLLHPDGREEVLVPGGKGSVTDPTVSFDGEWVYYSHFHDLTLWNHGFAPSTADIYKIHVPTRKIVRLTDGGFSPNTGAARWAEDYRKGQPGKTTMPNPVCNMGPCPLPGGKVIFTSNRNGFISPRPTNNGYNINLQLFVMDDDGSNVEMIGHLNIGAALHPVVLRDGRVMFSTLENQGQRDSLAWGLWSIHPDGTNWEPIISSFISTAFHFQTQTSDGEIVVGVYYGGVGTQGFCTYVKLPVEGNGPKFGPAYMSDPRNGPAVLPQIGNRQRSRVARLPFSPLGMQMLTCFADDGDDTAAQFSKDGPWVGKVTHPSAAPDNHLLTVWNARPKGDHDVDAGIYLIKSGKAIHEPGQMLMIKHDPKYDAQWPRALVPYQRIHGVNEPRYLKPLANDGKLSPHLPEGTPFGLVGTSSNYKRESSPDGQVAKGSVTATYPGKGPIPFDLGGRDPNYQGGDHGIYSNDQIHAIRIVALEPTTNRRDGFKAGRLFRSHAMERMRILGEIPVRKFTGDPLSATGGQPIDPDGNPDTSFLAKIPADVAWTFQTLDKDGMVLNSAQTWHQIRPGESRTDCGGCHAHSQQPTLFKDTAAARPDYPVFDLTKQTPLLTSKANDKSGKKWDTKDESGLRFANGVFDVEYHRHIKPILEKSCVACHTSKWEKPAGNLVLDDDRPETYSNGGAFPQAPLPNNYFRLVADHVGKFGYKPMLQSDGFARGSRYVWPMQSRRSLLTWKIFGRRTDGFSNDDFAIEMVPGDRSSLQYKGQPVDKAPSQNRGKRSFIGYVGTAMPPPEAVAGTYVGPDGQKIKVAPLSDEDRRTIVRWIDLGCPIDLDYDPAKPQERGFGWMLDDNRPTLTMTYPKPGVNGPLTRILVGMHDYDTGLDMDSFQVVADFALDGVAAGQNLASKFKAKTQGVWELTLAKPLTDLPKGKLTVSVKDKQGNITRIERTLSVTAMP
jgi:RNA polymerase sigma factor (sigma-70 family)